MARAPAVHSAPQCATCLKRHKGGVCPPASTGISELAALTARQRHVLLLLCEGRQNSDIAKQMGISIETVKHHLVTIFDLFGRSTREEVIVRVLPLLLNDQADALEAECDTLRERVRQLTTQLNREIRVTERLLGKPSPAAPVSSVPRVRGAPARIF